MDIQTGISYAPNPIAAINIGSLLMGLDKPAQTEALRSMLNHSNPNFASESEKAQTEIIQKQVLPAIGAPGSGTSSLSAFHPEQFYSPGQRALNVLGGAGVGVLKGIIPDERIEAPHSNDPLTGMAETATRIPTALVTGIVGGLLTGGAYNAASGGISANTRNRKAEDDALRAGNWAVAKSIRDANAAATLGSTAYSFAGARLPGAIGKTPLGKITTGAAMGYPQDLADQAIDQYTQTGKVDARQINYAPGLNTLLGGGIQAGIHYGPQVARSIKNGTAHEFIQASLARTAEKVGKASTRLSASARTSHSGHMGFKPPKDDVPSLPLQGDYKHGLTERQHAGEMTRELVPMTNIHKMHEDAGVDIDKAIASGHADRIPGWIKQHRDAGDTVKADTILMEAREPQRFSHFSADVQSALDAEAHAKASEAGLNLRNWGDNPLIKIHTEFREAAAKDFDDGKPVHGIEDAAKDVQELVEDSFNELFGILVRAFKFTSRRSRRAKGETTAPGKVKRTGKTPKPPSMRTHKLLARALADDPTKPKARKVSNKPIVSDDENTIITFANERLRAKAYIRKRLEAKGPKSKAVNKPLQFTQTERELIAKLDEQQAADKKNTLKLSLKRVKEPSLAEVLGKQRKAMLNAKESANSARRREALAALTKLERELNVQTKLSLNVKQVARQLSEDAMATLSPEELKYYKAMVARKNRILLFGKLEARLKAAERVGTKANGESLDDMYNRLEPLMTQGERFQYKARKTAIGRKKFLKNLNKTSGPAMRKSVMDRLMAAHDHELLSVSTPDVFGKVIKAAKNNIKINPDDLQTLNALIQGITDPLATPRAKRQAQALLDRFMIDHKTHNLFKRVVAFDNLGIILQTATQFKNYLDGGLSFVHYYGLHGVAREFGQAWWSHFIGDEYTGTGKRGVILQPSKRARDFYAKHETTRTDELVNIFFDVKHGTDTARDWGGDAVDGRGMVPTILHTSKPGKVGDRLRAADKVIGGTSRAITSAGDRLLYAHAVQSELEREIETHIRITGNDPDVNSDTYKNMRGQAHQWGSYVTLTNRGKLEKVANDTRKSISSVLGGVDAGRLILRFTTIPANYILRPLESIPGVGALGIKWNYGHQLDVSKVPINNRQMFGHIFASQLSGLLLAGAATGAVGKLAYDLGYFGAVRSSNQEKNFAAKKMETEAGFPEGAANYTAIMRYKDSGNPEDLRVQEGDSWFTGSGVNVAWQPLLFVTEPGRMDMRDKAPHQQGNTLRHSVKQLAGATWSMYADNGAFRGFSRPYDVAINARDPDTGERGVLPALAAEAGDIFTIKLPFQDSVPQPYRQPQDYWQMVFKGIPGYAQTIPASLDSEGNESVRRGFVTQTKTLDTYAGYMDMLHNTTGKANHILGPFPKEKTIGEGADAVTVKLTAPQRYAAEKDIKPEYAKWVQTVRDMISERETKAAEVAQEKHVAPPPPLAPIEIVGVLSLVKNDLTRAYLDRHFGIPLVQLTVTNSGVNEHDKDALGAKALYHGHVDEYRGIIEGYLDNAEDGQFNRGETRRERRIQGDPHKLY